MKKENEKIVSKQKTSRSNSIKKRNKNSGKIMESLKNLNIDYQLKKRLNKSNRTQHIRNNTFSSTIMNMKQQKLLNSKTSS